MSEGHFFEQKGLDASFYCRGVVDVAQDLLGKVLFVRNGGIFCAGRIVETEAYTGKTTALLMRMAGGVRFAMHPCF